MEKRFIMWLTCIMTSVLFAQHVSAQSSNSPFTLQQCIDYALTHYNDIKNAELDVQSAAAKVGETRGIGLPHLSGTASILDNPELKRLFLPGSQAANFSPPGIAYEADKVYGLPNIFQLRSTGDASLTLSQLLFDGSYLVGLKAASTYQELAKKSLVQTKIQVVENVTKAYYMALINREQLDLVKANVLRLDTLLQNTQAYQKQGFVEQIDVNRIEVARNNLKAELTKFNQMNDVTYLLLKFQMGMPLSDSISLSGTIRDVNFESVDKNIVAQPENRIEYSLLKTQRELSLLDVKNNRMKYLPSLSGFANAGYTRSDLDLGKVIQNEWFSYMMWGINLNVPILEGGSKLYKMKQAKYQYAKSENSLAQFSQVVDLQVKQSVISLSNEMENLQIQKRNLDLANEVVRVSKVKYAAGTGSNLEVIDAENGFKTAQTNYYSAVYGALLAKIEYQKSTGTLYQEQ
jgi:outer membrane protein